MVPSKFKQMILNDLLTRFCNDLPGPKVFLMAFFPLFKMALKLL